MTNHVDIVRNDWAHTAQVRLGSIELQLGSPELQGMLLMTRREDGPEWSLVLQTWDDAVRRDGAERAFNSLYTMVDSSVVVVTPPHPADECLFVKDDVVKMDSVGVEMFNR